MALQRAKLQIPLYLAVPQSAFDSILSEELGRTLIDKLGIQLLVFDRLDERIVKWIPEP